jgi:two-component system, NtrC family, nitrogen regulation sensor histidine kinase NtrY
VENQSKTRIIRGKSLWLIGFIVAILLSLLIILQTSNLWKSLSIETANDALILYALSTLNFIAFIVFGFIFIRNIVKLIRERRALTLGAKLKTRLLIYLSVLSLLPIIAMAGFSYLFLNRALERWFTQIPENVVRDARKVEIPKQFETARMLTKLLEKSEINDALLNQLAFEGKLSYLEIVSPNGVTSAKSKMNFADNILPDIERELQMLRQPSSGDNTSIGNQNFSVVVSKFADGRKLLLVPDLLPKANLTRTIDNSLIQLDDLKSQQRVVRLIGFSTLGLLTFLLIFASSWTAFHIARGLTVPVEAIARASDEIARGNFSHRVDVFAEDELNVLVTAFNQMAVKLDENSQELSERRKYTETVLQSLNTGVISFDSENSVTTINNAAISMFRLENAHFQGFTLEDLLGEENRIVLERLLSRAKRIGTATEQTILAREITDGNTDSGEALPVALTATALPENNGVVLVIEDLTELIAAQRASAWQEVARRMAHEIKNPLTPIQLSAERIKKNFYRDSGKERNDEQFQKVLDESTATIISEVGSLKAMVDEFSRFARLPNVKLESADINQLISQTVLLFEDRGIEIDVQLAEDLPLVMVDEEQIRRVLVNIIENSCEAFAESQESKSIVVRSIYSIGRELVIVEVLDNGKGIDPRHIQKLFQPYYSTKGRGTGLGLAIVQRILQDHGGKITASNNPTGGAKFSFELPILRSL